MFNVRFTWPISIVLFFFLAGFVAGIPGPAPRANHVRTLIIDPGHCNINSGTRGLISTEQEVTLAVALKLGEAVKKTFPGIKIVFTHTTLDCAGNATNLRDDLNARARIANQARGDLFVSIHCNATPHPPGSYYEKRVIGHQRKLEYVGRGKKRKKRYVNAPIYRSYLVKNTRVGTETYIWKADRLGSKTDAISGSDEEGEISEDGGEGNGSSDSTGTGSDSSRTGSKEQRQAEAAAFDVSSPEAKMRAQLYEKRFFDNSALFAGFIEEGFSLQGRNSKGVMQRDKGIRVLEATGMPSVLIEIGFLSNQEEEEYLNSDKGQNDVVDNIIDALKRYTGVTDAPFMNSKPAVTNIPVDSSK